MGNIPDGTDILKILIALYADQEGVRIDCEIEDDEKEGDLVGKTV